MRRAGQARPLIRVAGGDLSREADEAEQALIGAGLPIFVRAGALVSPVCEEAPAAKNRTTIVARLRKLTVDGIIDWLSRYADFQRYDARAKKWVSIDPPERVAKIILSREGAGKFPQIAGVITTPILRPDGSVLTEPGYDASTRLYLALDPEFTMPLIPAAPSRAEALDALALLSDLLSGFPFVSPVDRAVALSGIMTAVLRGALSVAPMHVFRAHTAGTGKSLLVDVAATIATGQTLPRHRGGQDRRGNRKTTWRAPARRRLRRLTRQRQRRTRRRRAGANDRTAPCPRAHSRQERSPRVRMQGGDFCDGQQSRPCWRHGAARCRLHA